MKKIIAIILAGVGILLAGAAETLAVPVERGFVESDFHSRRATFSDATFEVSNFAVGGGAFTSLGTFNTGTFDFSIGNGSGTGTLRIGSVSCVLNSGPGCGGTLTFIYPANLLPDVTSTADATFTMTGHLTLGSTTLAIEGSGIVHVGPTGSLTDPILARFVVAEPSTVVLVLSGLVAVGWSRSRGGKRAGRSRSTAAPD